PRILLTAVLGAPAGALLGALVGSLLVGLVLAVLGAAAAGLWQRGRGVAARWRMGAVGERRTGRSLDRLRRRGWTVLHDRALPTGRANVDHLLVSPHGEVFNVDSKVRTGAARYDARRNYLRIGRASGYQLISSTLYETDRITRALEREVGHVEVRSVLAVHRGKLPFWRPIELKGVRVLSARHVRRWLASRSGPAPARGREAAPSVQRLRPPFLSHCAPRADGGPRLLPGAAVMSGMDTPDSGVECYLSGSDRSASTLDSGVSEQGSGRFRRAAGRVGGRQGRLDVALFVQGRADGVAQGDRPAAGAARVRQGPLVATAAVVGVVRGAGDDLHVRRLLAAW